MRFFYLFCSILNVVLIGFSIQNAVAQEQSLPADSKIYQVQPGDVLSINVWKEEGLQQEVLVRPDGGMSFPRPASHQYND
jgi:polysaccharide export outer membrane protein